MGASENVMAGEVAATDERSDDVQERLQAIAAAVAARTESMNEASGAKSYDNGMACPIDPAERAACEGCQ